MFQREDLWVCEQIQRGLAASTDELVFGELESSIRDFHATLDQQLGASASVQTQTSPA